jgi:hypothetical protein
MLRRSNAKMAWVKQLNFKGKANITYLWALFKRPALRPRYPYLHAAQDTPTIV